jgi:hypothetical protein
LKDSREKAALQMRLITARRTFFCSAIATSINAVLAESRR